MDIKEVLFLWFINFFDKNSASLSDKSAKGGGVNNEFKQNEQLAKELHKSIIKKNIFKKFILHLKTIFAVLT